MEIELQLTKLEDYYANRQPGLYHVELELLVENYFKSCREMADSLWQHSAAGLSKRTVMQFVLSESSLKICDGMVQTIKHSKRKPTTLNRDPLTSWIEWFDSAAGMQIKWENYTGGASGQIDALDLARKCHDAWHNFLQAKGLL
jgi:hypothetical protein